MRKARKIPAAQTSGTGRMPWSSITVVCCTMLTSLSVRVMSVPVPKCSVSAASVLVMRRATPLFEKQQRFLDRMNLSVRESITGVRVVRAFNKENLHDAHVAERAGDERAGAEMLRVVRREGQRLVIDGAAQIAAEARREVGSGVACAERRQCRGGGNDQHQRAAAQNAVEIAARDAVY